VKQAPTVVTRAAAFAQQTRRGNVCIASGPWLSEPEVLAGPGRLFPRVGVEHLLPCGGGVRLRRLGEDTVEVEQAGVQPIVEANTARLSP
jgi:hypothetical protein